jgi:hypothetical protein
MGNLKSVLLLMIIPVLSTPSNATLSLPSGLSTGEQQLILQYLGFGSSFHPVDNPYPLGGYSGFEVGVSAHNISTQDIGYYGNRTSVDRNVIYPLINIGKGIFDNIDLLFSFVPFNESTGIGIYSGALRWCFYQATFVPASFSFLISGSNTNFNNLFNSQITGADIVTGVNVDPFSFYVGAGTVYGQAQFDSSLTVDGTNTNQVSRAFHTMLGMNVSIAEYFTAIEVDTYNSTVISLKFGARL